MKDIIILLRPQQWIKNIFVFAPLFFSFSFYNTKKLQLTLFTFIIFSIAASCIYIVNDILDIKEDQLHPEKKSRPIASGRISIKKAFKLSIILFLISILLSYIVSNKLTIIIFVYFVNNICYSLGFKNTSILDVIMIAFGFILRILAGGLVANIDISIWILIMTFLLAVFLALAKRRDDIILYQNGLSIRKNIGGYNLEFINSSMTLMAGVIIVSYLLYSVSIEVEQKFDTKYLFITFLFVAMGLLRYLQITFVESRSGNPTNLLYKDHFIQLVILFWLGSFYLIVNYF